MTEIIQTNIGEVTISTKYRPKCGEYTMFEGCVYYVVASMGMITDYKLTLESEGRQERFTVKQPEVGQLRRIISPTGHISC